MLFLRDFESLSHIVDQLDDLAEVGRPVQLYVLQRPTVSIEHAVETVTLRVKYIPVECETVRRAAAVVHAQVKGATEAERWKLFVTVIKLQYVANRLKRLEILIVRKLRVVQRMWITWLSIRQRKVDSNGKIELASAKDIVEEGVTLLEAKLLEGDGATDYLVEAQGAANLELAQLLDIGNEVAEVLVDACLVRLEELQLDVFLFVLVAEVCEEQTKRVEDELEFVAIGRL